MAAGIGTLAGRTVLAEDMQLPILRYNVKEWKSTKVSRQSSVVGLQPTTHIDEGPL
jgi:hypothetical protein